MCCLLLLSVDLASLLPKAGVAVGGSVDSDLGAMVEGPSAEDLGQSLVFTNSHHNGRTATHSYAHATANSYAHAASASTTYAHAALVQKATHFHMFKHQQVLKLMFIYLQNNISVFSSCSVSLILFLVLSPGFWFWVSECT